MTIVSNGPCSFSLTMMKMVDAGGGLLLADRMRIVDGRMSGGHREPSKRRRWTRATSARCPGHAGKAAWKFFVRPVEVLAALAEQGRVIFIRRNIDEILALHRKTLVNRGEDPLQNDASRRACSRSDPLHIDLRLVSHLFVCTLFVHYSDMLGNPRPQIERVNAFLGGKLDTARMGEVVDPAAVSESEPSVDQYSVGQSQSVN